MKLGHLQFRIVKLPGSTCDGCGFIFLKSPDGEVVCSNWYLILSSISIPASHLCSPFWFTQASHLSSTFQFPNKTSGYFLGPLREPDLSFGCFLFLTSNVLTRILPVFQIFCSPDTKCAAFRSTFFKSEQTYVTFGFQLRSPSAETYSTLLSHFFTFPQTNHISPVFLTFEILRRTCVTSGFPFVSLRKNPVCFFLLIFEASRLTRILLGFPLRLSPLFFLYRTHVSLF